MIPSFSKRRRGGRLIKMAWYHGKKIKIIRYEVNKCNNGFIG